MTSSMIRRVDTIPKYPERLVAGVIDAMKHDIKKG